MQPTTDRFALLCRQTHVIAATCDLYFPDGSPAVAVPVLDGQVTIDRTAQARRSGSVVIPWSLRAGEDLGLDLRTLPLGGYALVKRGLRYADGSTELVTLGRLRIESVSWGTGAEAAQLELTDRMAQVRDEPFTAPFAVRGMTPWVAAYGIVHAVFGDAIGYAALHNPATVLTDTVYTGDRADALTDLEQGADAEAFFDANGDFVFDQKPGDDEPVVWSVNSGEAGVMVSAGESLDRTGIYNGVLVTGQGDGTLPPVSALVVHSTAGSPIAWGGPFGKVALLADSTTVTTAGQAAAVAASLLRLRLKRTRMLNLTAAPNPALEAGDTIEVRFPDGRAESHLIDFVTTSLTTAAQAITTRTMEDPAAPSVGLLAREGVDAHYGAEAWRELNDARVVA